MPGMKNAAPVGQPESGAKSSHTLKSTSAEPPINTVLAALEGVRKSGSGWIARCPAHDDKNPSLSIGEGDDGRVLVRCWALCDFRDIAAAAGLSVFDFFPPRPLDTPQQKRAARQRRREADWSAALRVLAHEATVLLVLAADLDAGPLEDNGRDRLRLAVSRVMAAKEALA